jgi:hypothetical protein
MKRAMSIRAIADRVARMFPQHRVVSVQPMAADTGARADASAKSAGYGEPLRIVLTDERGVESAVVWRVASSNAFGHDRRADRAASTIQAYEDFGRIPRHVAPLDLGVVMTNGALVSLRDAAEHYLITPYAPGTLYADDLRRIARAGEVAELDLERLDAMASYLASLHVPVTDGIAYRRAIRDLVGSGEGIYGIVDGYPAATPARVLAKLTAIEAKCARWRSKLRDRPERLTRTHGDFHPFNIVFGTGTELALLDASRGARGDPADDLTALAVNFIFFAIDQRDSWRECFGPLWHRWWQRYLELRSDRELLEVAPPFLAWRILVVANPVFYPQLSERGRDALLDFADDVLTREALDPARAEELFR